MTLRRLLAELLAAVRRVFAGQAMDAVHAARRAVMFDPRRWDEELARQAEPPMVGLVSSGVVEEARLWVPTPKPIIPPPPRVPTIGTALLEPRRIVMRGNVRAPEIAEAARRLSFDFAHSVNGQTAERLVAPYTEFRERLFDWADRGESINKLSQELRTIIADPKRALTIARTEGRRATEEGRMMAAKRASITLGKRWVASPTACPICLELASHRKPIPLDQPFAVDAKGGPYAVTMHPPRHPNCFCSTAFVPL